MVTNSTVGDIEKLLKEKRQEILSLAAKHGASSIRLFGSVARRQADAQSDIDFLIEMRAGSSLFDLGALQMDLQDLLGCKVDVVTPEGLRGRIRERVLSEALAL